MYLKEFADKLEQQPELKAQFEANPVETVKQAVAVAGAPLATDVLIYRIVVISLGLALVFGMVGALVLAFFGKDVPAEATALGSAAVGALAGLLAPSPVHS